MADDIGTLCDEYVEASDHIAALKKELKVHTETEKELRSKILEMMQEMKIEHLPCGRFTIHVTTSKTKKSPAKEAIVDAIAQETNLGAQQVRAVLEQLKVEGVKHKLRIKGKRSAPQPAATS
jgi:phosphomannomutase